MNIVFLLITIQLSAIYKGGDCMKKYRNIHISEVENVHGYDGNPSGLYLCDVKDKITKKRYRIKYHLSFSAEGYVISYSNPYTVGFHDAWRNYEEGESLGCPNGIAFPETFKIIKKL